MLTEDRRSLITLLYPWFKEEVFRRRAQMVWLTGLASTVLLVLLSYLTTMPVRPEFVRATRIFLAPGVLLFAGLMAYLVLQQHDRHRQAKQLLSELERELKLFDGDATGSKKALYPTEWQTAWQQDRSVIVYLTVIGAMTILVLAAILAN